MQRRLGPVGFGHRDQLGHLHAVARPFANQGDGGVLVTIPGGRSYGQAQPMPGRCRP